MWRALRSQWPEITFTSRWIDEAHKWSGADFMETCRQAWTANDSDVHRAEFVITYADARDQLRGGLVEVGMALARRKRVLCIGTHASYGTWQYHPLVARCPSFESAREIINAQDKYS